MLSEQLYQLKSKSLAANGAGDNRAGSPDLARAADGSSAGLDGAMSPDFALAERVQKDKMVELLKRNHDVMMEKYETYRLRNEGLEKKALEKENLYVVIKSENDKLANQLYQLKR